MQRFLRVFGITLLILHLDIEGGTHEYFGDYVSKLDDAIAEKAISHDRQTEIVVQSTVEFLAGVPDDR